MNLYNSLKINIMKKLPFIDDSFNLEKALKAYGFQIDERESEKIAHGFPNEDYGEIWIAFDFTFLGNSHKMPIDMCIFRYTGKADYPQENLYKGIAPTNQQDYDTLMQLVFPSKEYVSRIESQDKYL